VLKPRLLQQRLLVLQVPTLPVPPVTNKKNQQLITYKTAYSANYNQEKPILKTKTYHKQPPSRRTNSKIKKIKRKPAHKNVRRNYRKYKEKLEKKQLLY
jgi:hypothetical protein